MSMKDSFVEMVKEVDESRDAITKVQAEEKLTEEQFNFLTDLKAMLDAFRDVALVHGSKLCTYDEDTAQDLMDRVDVHIV